ncbi:hypothetical protein GWI33_006143 [Rhynchophorus ferrugineus]|uniref:Uncharacterized protein n=1 Tax=Rhynchophorus ferrugineus TaxID=354439 RepID=A0A834IJ73_RHYFE|nr:hypothetical protein GWI33_006143 [Rhynchophorus ferrugineus]
MDISREIEHQSDMYQISLKHLLEEQQYYGVPSSTSTPIKCEEVSSDVLGNYEESVCISSYTSDKYEEDFLIKLGCQGVFYQKPEQIILGNNNFSKVVPWYSDGIQHNQCVNMRKKCRKSLFETSACAVKKIKTDEEDCRNISIDNCSLVGDDFASTSLLGLNTAVALDSELSLSYLDRLDMTDENNANLTHYYENIVLAGYDNFFKKEKIDEAEQLLLYETVLTHAITYLSYCNVEGFVGSFVHVQAERLRLLTEKIILIRSAQQSTIIRESTKINLNADIHLDDIKFSMIKSEDPEIAKTRNVSYFLLVIRNHRTVLASNIAEINNHRFVVFIGPYIFNDVSQDFLITAELFIIDIPLISAANSSSHMLPRFNLIGHTIINVNNAKDERFFILDAYDTPIGILTSSVEIKLKYPEELRGCFSVITRDYMHLAEQFIKRCVLRKGEVLYSLDDDDEDCMVTRCVLPLNTLTFCCKTVNFLTHKSYLTLKFLDQNKEKTIYLLPSDNSDLAIWESRIRMICDNLSKWNMNNKR